MVENHFEKLVSLIAEQWNILKDDLYAGVVKYDDLEKLINEYIVFNRFDNVIKDTSKFYEVNLHEVKHMYRGVLEEIELDYYERMIPKLEFATVHNRMNPPGKAFSYLGILVKDKCIYDKTNKNHVVKTVLKEIRAPEKSVATICKFYISESAKNKKVLNICGDSSIPKMGDELSKYIFKNAFDIEALSLDREKLSYILANVYFNMFSSDQIFKPINTVDQEVKKYEYAPFHALANYISEQGYAGIIFKSTVHQCGINLVLFNPDDACVLQNSMEHIHTSEYL